MNSVMQSFCHRTVSKFLLWILGGLWISENIAQSISIQALIYSKNVFQATLFSPQNA